MIPRSAAIATAAILLSLLIHLLGLILMPLSQSGPPATGTAPDVVALGNAFEDIAEAAPAPVQPEPTPAPDVEISEALVASDDPQQSFSPDTGTARLAEPDLIEPTAPDTVEPAGGDAGEPSEPAVTAPVEPATAAEPPIGNPDATDAPPQTEAAEPALTPPVAPAPQQLAALPEPTAPVVPVTPSVAPSAIPVVPLSPAPIEPVEPEETTETAPETPEPEQTEDATNGSDLAVRASPRPPSRRPVAEPRGQRDGSSRYSELLNPSLIESPLVAYQRNRTDPGIRNNGGARAGELSFHKPRNTGNAGVTNYAGRVLVHLNKAPIARLSVHGLARVSFEINPDGSLARVDIIDSTGLKEVERAAVAQVRNAAPFPRPPDGTSKRLAFVYRSN